MAPLVPPPAPVHVPHIALLVNPQPMQAGVVGNFFAQQFAALPALPPAPPAAANFFVQQFEALSWTHRG
jgi:hypothetical protein